MAYPVLYRGALHEIAIRTSYMKKPYTPPVTGEPIGIIISRGAHDAPTPTFAAYIWGPAPDVTDETSKAA